MSCRSTHAGSSFTTYARLQSGGLNDSETLSLFHALRRRYEEQSESNRRIYTEEEYRSLLLRQIERINRRRNDMRADVVASMLNRIAMAQDEVMPAQDIIYALHNITPKARTRAQNLERFYIDTALRSRQPVSEVQSQFRELVSSVGQRTSGRRHASTNLELSSGIASQYGLGNDRGTLYAITVLSEQSRAIEDSVQEITPRRIHRQLISDPSTQNTGIPNLRLLEIGYDPRNSRLEVLIFDMERGTSQVYSYCNVNSSWFMNSNGFPKSNAGLIWANEMRGNSYYQYHSIEEEESAGRAPNCLNCGQFADVNHSCPMSGEAREISRDSWTSRWSKLPILIPAGLDSYRGNAPEYTLKIELPAIREFRTTVAAGPVKLKGIIQGFLRQVEGQNWYETTAHVVGDITIYKDEENNIRVNTSQLICNCLDKTTDGDCLHIDTMSDAIKARLAPPTRGNANLNSSSRQISQETITRAQTRVMLRAQELVKSAVDADWTRKELTLAEAKANWRNDAEVLYYDNFTAFRDDYETAILLRQENNNEPVIPYLKENALDGMATRDSGQGFGVEIEYEFNSSITSYSAANSQIGRELLAANLTPDDRQQNYHAARSNGYRDTHTDEYGRGNWSLERDGSVSGGELVSPTMYDEPETWDKLEKAIEILKRNGATPTIRAGGHVHVGTALFGEDPTKYTELSRLMTQHEDVLYRLASDPNRGTHRGRGYAAPSPVVPIDGFTDVTSLRNSTGGRGRALNYTNINGDESDHAEFRLFDSSLNPGAIQTHIKLAVAMTHAAIRIAENNGTKRGKEQVGSHDIRGKSKSQDEEPIILEEDSSTLRSLLDTLFSRREDKAQAVAVFANTKWSEPDRSY